MDRHREHHRSTDTHTRSPKEKRAYKNKSIQSFLEKSKIVKIAHNPHMAGHQIETSRSLL